MIKDMKRITAIFMALVIVFALCGCGNPEKGDTSPFSDDFVILDLDNDFINTNYRSYTVYHKDTGVVYIVLTATHSIEIEMTPLYNADGSVMTLDDWSGNK